MQKNVDVLTVKDNQKFEVHCRAGDAGELCVGAESVSVKVGQRLRRDGGQEIWHSVGIYAKEEEDGNSSFKWDEALQIASIKSRPQDAGCSAALGCNLDHVTS